MPALLFPVYVSCVTRPFKDILLHICNFRQFVDEHGSPAIKAYQKQHDYASWMQQHPIG
jgi:hypothetical protein